MSESTPALAAWLVTYLLHSTLLCGLAWLIDRRRLLRAPAAREYLWRAALIGALVTATAQSGGLAERAPHATLRASPRAIAGGAAMLSPRPMPGAATAGLSAPATNAVAATADLALVTPPAGRAPHAALDRLGARFAAHWTGWITLAWLAGAALAALRLLLLGWLARRELASRAPAGTTLAGEFAGLCAARGVAAPALSVAPALAGPVSLPNGEIVVPPWAVTSLVPRQRRALLAHELAHQVRRDPLWRLLALGIEAVLWLQPFNRLARRRLANLAELEADAWAARTVNDPRALAECLAECAGRLVFNRAAHFGVAMAAESPLIERVDRLLKGPSMNTQGIAWPIRVGVIAALVTAPFLLPGCRVGDLRTGHDRVSTRVSISDDGESSVTVRRAGYSLVMESSGKATFAEDESDLATLEAGAVFTLTERLSGVKHAYVVKADGAGALSRAYSRDDKAMPMDATARQWLAAALPRMFRESGHDAGARVDRLLARGGPARVLAEVALAGSDHAKADYLGRLLRVATLDTAEIGLALAAATGIGSDYELSRALGLALETQPLDAPRFTLLLNAANRIGSDHDRAELLTAAAKRLPANADARAAWLAAAAQIGSDYELRRSLAAALEPRDHDPGCAPALVALAAERLGSDFELRSLLETVAPRAADPALAAAYLAAVRRLDSDFERRTALITLLDKCRLDTVNLQGALDAAAGLGSDFEKRTVLAALAGRVAADPVLNRRYREVARTMNDFERGAALQALDDAMGI
jgi:beta-lactamase regulating signal transducer with metallopeptidase domain